MSELLMNWLIALAVALLGLLGYQTSETSFSGADIAVGEPAAYAYFSGHFGSAEDATALAQRNGCMEDEVLVAVIAEVQPDDGQPPNVDWAPRGDLTGTLACVNAEVVER